MPSQRAKGIKLIGAYVTNEEHAVFVKLAKAKGLTAADLLRKLVQKFLESQNIKK